MPAEQRPCGGHSLVQCHSLPTPYLPWVSRGSEGGRGGGFPELYGAVRAGRGKSSTVGAEGDGGDRPVVCAEGAPASPFEEAVPQRVGSINPTIKPCILAQPDHPPQAVAVPLEQVGKRPAIPGAKPLEQLDGITRWVVHDLAHTL